jgi:ferritin
MEISKKMQDAVNEQINKELYSGYLYLAMAAYCDNENFTGSAAWLKKQAGEEYEHAMKLYEHVVDRGGRVEFKQIDMPKKEWNSIINVFEEAYDHEQKVSKMIDNLQTLARNENERATEIFLNWFVEEQIEEEASTNDVLQKFKMVGESKGSQLMIDKHLGKRE